MPDFLYRDDPSGFEAFDPRFGALLLGNAWLERLVSGLRWAEGPVWMGDWDCLLFQDLPANRTLRWRDGINGAKGRCEVFRAPSNYANGQARDPAGRLISCSHGLRAVTRTERNGEITVLASCAGGKRLNAPNDVAVRGDGTVWFTDPLYGLQSDYEGGRRPSEQSPAVYRLRLGDECPTRVASDFDGPNGLAFSPDGTRLYVSETGDQTRPDPDQSIRAFDVAADGTLSGGQEFARVSHGYCDGMAVDEDGRLWSSAADGIHCLSPGGAPLGRIRVPERVSNLAFGGPLGNRLFATASTSLYALSVNVRGAPV